MAAGCEDLKDCTHMVCNMHCAMPAELWPRCSSAYACLLVAVCARDSMTTRHMPSK